MKSLFKLTLVLALLGGGLYLTNPDQEAFSEFLAVHVQNELADDVPGESELGRKLRTGLGKMASAAAAGLTERNDLIVASLYTIEIAGESHVFLGVAGQFVSLKGS